MNHNEPDDIFDNHDTPMRGRAGCVCTVGGGACQGCDEMVDGYGLTPPERPVARPVYLREADEWNETLTDSQEFGAILVGYILLNNPGRYAQAVAMAGFDTHAEVAAISDYIALAHPTLRRLTNTTSTVQQHHVDPRHAPAVEWLTWWVLAGNTKQWSRVDGTGPQRHASRALRDVVARDGIHVVLDHVQYAAGEACDLATVWQWVQRMDYCH